MQNFAGPEKSRRALRYGIALLAVAAATALRFAADPILLNHLPYVTYFVATTAVAWLGGIGPALLCTFAGFAAADWFFMAPREALAIPTPVDAIPTIAYFIVSLSISLFSHALQRSRVQAQRGSEQAVSRQRALEREVAERRRAEAALLESERKYRSLFETMGEGFALCEQDKDEADVATGYRFREVNSAFERHTGRGREQILGFRMDEILPGLEPVCAEHSGMVVLHLPLEGGAIVGVHQTDPAIAGAGGVRLACAVPGEVRDAAGSRPDDANDAAARAGSASGLRVLVVEDHADTARLLARLLGVAGHDVDVAENVRNAVVAAESQSYDVIVSDLGLPDGSGHDLIVELRRRGNPVPAIALSGYGTRSDIERSLASGFYEHLIKPVRFDALLEALRHPGVIPVREELGSE